MAKGGKKRKPRVGEREKTGLSNSQGLKKVKNHGCDVINKATKTENLSHGWDNKVSCNITMRFFTLTAIVC